ncbi:MAG: trigger factor family protein [Paludibacteraceae bacterium]|nr:trigger factor family protein [Paludibacteraceae bacterium]
MNIVRKDLDALNATLTFNIVKSDYEEKVNKAIKDYSKKVNMPGFRPGKVPAGLIKKQF